MKTYYIQEDTNPSINIKDQLIKDGALPYFGDKFVCNLIALVSTGKENNSFDIIHVYCKDEFDRIKNLHGKDRYYFIDKILVKQSKFNQDTLKVYTWKEVRELIKDSLIQVETTNSYGDIEINLDSLEDFYQNNL